MIRARLLVWLVALVALAAPPLSAGAAHAATPRQVTTHCPDHAPPTNPCPDHDTAKHAAGTCCPSMSGSLALMPAVDTGRLPGRTSERAVLTIAVLSGQTITKDPPPPRA